MRAVVEKQSHADTDLRAQYEQVVEQVRQTKESTLQVDTRRFDAPVDKIQGTIASASFGRVELKEYPGRAFHFSSVGSSMADLVADTLGRSNSMTRAQAAQAADTKLQERDTYLSSALAEGTRVNLTVGRGAADNSQQVRAVIEADGVNINQDLIDRGFGRFRKDLGGPEEQAMHGSVSKALGSYAEAGSFEGDNSRWNPLRYLPGQVQTKLWQERTAYSQYLQQEAIGTRMRRWERPIHDFLSPYLRGVVERVADVPIIPGDVQARRDLDTLTDQLGYLRSLNSATTRCLASRQHKIRPRARASQLLALGPHKLLPHDQALTPRHLRRSCRQFYPNRSPRRPPQDRRSGRPQDPSKRRASGIPDALPASPKSRRLGAILDSGIRVLILT